jgi:RNA polymerase sigma factor (TIGR02999 family)
VVDESVGTPSLSTRSELTTLLNAAGDGDAIAADRLLDLVYQELRAMAGAMTRRESPGKTIEATDLVHEAYLRLFGKPSGEWPGRAYFFAAAAEAMRRILIEQARRRQTARRGGGRSREPLDDIEITIREDATDLIALDQALDRLEREDPQKATLVKLRYFIGLTIPQAAEAIGVSHATAERHWAYSRARLFQWVSGGGAEAR